MALVVRGIPRRLVYLGTPALAVPPLQALVTAGFDVALVVTRPDTRRGRGTDTSPSPVKAAALDLGLPVSHTVDDVVTVNADAGVVVAFGQLIKPHVLAALGMVNLHFSLLPRWRGAAPVERALLAGDAETGVDLMALEEGLDTGPVYARERVAIAPDDTLASLRARLTEVGTTLLVASLSAGLGEPEAQHGEVTYAAKITSSDLMLDWKRPAVELERIVRLGGAWTTVRGKRLKVHAARLVDTNGEPGALSGVTVHCGVGGLELVQVQPEGKAPMAAAAWRNGVQLADTERMGA